MTFANSLDPDQAPAKYQAWSGPKLFDTMMVFLKEFFQKVDFEKNRQTTKKSMQKLPSRQRQAREPLYLNSAFIVCWLQWTSAKIVYLAVKKGNILVYILLLKIFIANYRHL